tara:strand:- start:10982 stop:11962 length:981 start_codon:yes stop_codon:yes gene_type:complete
MKIAINKIKRNPYDTREDNGDLSGLKRSIERNELLQPLPARKANGHYELVFGGRRLEAMRELGYDRIEIDPRKVSNEDMSVIAICENVHRKDLNPVELARAYNVGLKQTGLSIHAFGKAIGKNSTAIASYLPILDLPDRILKNHDKYKISELIALGRTNGISRSARIMMENAIDQNTASSQLLRQIALSCEAINSSRLPQKTKNNLYGQIILQDYSHLKSSDSSDIKDFADVLLNQEISKHIEGLKRTEEARKKKKKKKISSVRHITNPDRKLDTMTDILRRTSLHLDRVKKQNYYDNSKPKARNNFRRVVNKIVKTLDEIISDEH